MAFHSIHTVAQQRILVLDGGLGTMIQTYALGEEDYRGVRFESWHKPLKGCNDLLVLSRPQIIEAIHRAYLEAGADIISTDSFNANSVSLSDYGLEAYVYEINREAARIARRVADEFAALNPHKPRFVAGSMGPTNCSCSISSDVSSPSSRAVTFDTLKATYKIQAEALLEGGADILLVETVFDTLNCKAALVAIDEVCEARGVKIPVMVSATLTDSGRTLSGQTIEAFYYSVAHAELLSVGLNCSFGAKRLQPYVERLAAVAACRVSVHPNAGLPNVMGGYDETPTMFAADMEHFMAQGIVNIVGGCCGTTPEHILRLSELVSHYSPRPLPENVRSTVFCGLEPLVVRADTNFIDIGERTNVAGSAKFARLIREGNYGEAVSIARRQVEAGAQIIDVCMDDGMIDGEESMKNFLNMIASEPDIARVPIMIDSSKWEVIEAGLKCTQGRSIVNSISLKEGETEFLRRASIVRRYGAAVVVMLFDERGQADTYERKIEVAERAYRLLTEHNFSAEDIIFDPNILAIATGIESHNTYARDYIEACRWIKRNLPLCKVSGGVSNLSFAFRGNNSVREAMHSVFLYHAIGAGMDMGIVNTAMLQIYSEIEPRLAELCEAAILCRRADAAERLSDFATEVKTQQATSAVEGGGEQWRVLPSAERIRHAMLKGLDEYIGEDALEAYRECGKPLTVIDEMLMPAMSEVGELFGAGKMFLPQVVKSARVMKRAVEALTPYIDLDKVSGGKSVGRVVMATVRGDVHDIGKNIVSVVLACNGYEIRDLGVMVDSLRIVEEVVAWNADVVGLSGLITPSLDEMVKVCAELERRGIRVDVIIGGATTSELHTAVRIAPVYSGVVVHGRNASDNVTILGRLLGADRERYIAELKQRQAALRRDYLARQTATTLRSLTEANSHCHTKNLANIVVPKHIGRVVVDNFTLAEVERYINWNFFFSSWELKGRYPQILSSADKGAEARRLFEDAQSLLSKIREEGLLQLRGVVGIYPAYGRGNDIVLSTSKGEVVLPQLRNQSAASDQNLSLADFVARKGAAQDYVGAFALSAGFGLQELCETFRSVGDDYNAIMSKLLADRLTEAFAEALHEYVRTNLWGYQSEAMSTEEILREHYLGRRFAFGYPATPDHSLKRDIFDLLDVPAATGMSLTENFMITPGEALCGLIIADPNVEYFAIGQIGDDQMADYAARRGTEVKTLEKLLDKI